MSRDRIYTKAHEATGPFEFSERVVRVFPDMIGRSVPGYHLLLEITGLLARQVVVDDSRVYDLGCSLGAASLEVRRSIHNDNVEILAIDNAPAMIERCQALINEDNSRIPVRVIEGNILDHPIENASLIVMYFTLQFIEPEKRAFVVERIFKGLRPGGVFLLAEKLASGDEFEQDWLTDSHHDFKRAQGYSDLEIARKRQALDNVLIPDTRTTHHRRLKNAGFERVVDYFQCLNFSAMAAFRAP